MQRQHSVMAERELGWGGGVGAVKHPSSTSLRGDANLFLNLQSGNVNTSWVFSKPASFPEAAAAAVTVADFSAAAPATLTSLNQRTICRICDGPCAVADIKQQHHLGRKHSMQAPGIRWTGGWGQGFWQSQASAWAGTCGCSSPSHISEEASAAVREAVSCGEGMGTDSASFSRIRAAVLIGAACTATRPTCKQHGRNESQPAEPTYCDRAHRHTANSIESAQADRSQH